MKKLLSPFKLYRQELPRHSYFKQLFHTYALVSCILFVLFSILLIFYVNNDYQDTLIQVQKDTINQSYELNNTLLLDIASNCNSYLDDSDLIQILYSDSTNVPLLLQARTLNDQIRQSSSIIHSVYFINYAAGMIMDTYNRCLLDQHYDTELIDFLQELSPSRHIFVGYPRQILRENQSIASKVFSIIFFSNKNGALVVNIDYDSYSQLIQMESSDYLTQFQVSSDQKVIACSDDSLFGADLSTDPIFTEISSYNNTVGYFETKLQKKNCRIDYRHNSGLGITYYGIFNGTALYTSNHMIWFVILCGICFMLLGLLVTFFVSLVVYRPVHHLKQELSADPAVPSSQAADVDDFAYLSGIYHSISEANRQLSRIKNTYLKEKDRSVLKKLLTSDNEILPRQYESLNQYFSGAFSQIVIISIDYESLQKEDSDGVALLKYAITNVMNELFDSSVLYMNLDLVSPNINYFINHNDASQESVLDTLRQGQEFLQKHFQITLSIGLGLLVTELEELSVSFSSAQEALGQRFLKGNGMIQPASLLHLADASKQHYPYEADTAIMASIKSMDCDSLEEALNCFFTAIEEFHIDQLLRTILQLDAALQRLENTCELSSKSLSWDLETLPLLNISTLQSCMLDRCQKDIAELTEIKSHSNEKPELIQTIIELVDKNLYNPNLSVVYLAAEVHLSVNYLRSIFKENTGDSLSSYITAKKIALICDLLKNTDTSLQDISDQLGFSTKNYFFTFFKKHMQMTPNEYRKDSRKI